MSQFSSIPRDVKEFLEGYPDNRQIDAEDDHSNLRFYSNEIKSVPDELLIEELLEKWKGEYEVLERRHGFIQWLFPIPEQSMANPDSKPLTEYEIEQMKTSPTILARLKMSYELMLDFYGMQLLNAETGLIGRKEGQWEERYQNLIYNTHNHKRITRILKCLSLLSHPKYVAPFVLHVLNEQSENGQLNSSIIKRTLGGWWANCNKSDQERETIRAIIIRISDNHWKLTRATLEQMIHTRETQGTLLLPDE